MTKAYKALARAHGWNVHPHKDPNPKNQSGYILKHDITGLIVQTIFSTPHEAWQIAGEQIEAGIEPN